MCKIKDCNNAVKARQLCNTHYEQLRRNQKPTDSDRCKVDSCGRRKNSSIGYCNSHYKIWVREGVERPLKQKHEPRITDNGYVLVYAPEHPNRTKTGHMMQHRLVMSEYLNRPLYDNENVHHKNGIREDNRIENLELWIVSQPAGQRVEDILEWARQIIDRYEPVL